MIRPAPSEPGEETISVPGSVRFPVELTPPEGFDPARPETWPDIAGGLECVAGRLLYMPPSGFRHQWTVTDVVAILASWRRSHPEFFVGAGEAGMRLHGDTRGADAAVWRRSDVGPLTPSFMSIAPILAVEVQGRYESSRALADKARWYLERGVSVVWLVYPATQHVVVVKPIGESRYEVGTRLPACPELPDLTPEVSEFFSQVSQET